MNTNTYSDFPVLPENSTFNIRLVLSLTSEPLESGKQLPLNLAMVIDNSGSMAGEKIEKVKAAASMIAGLLTPRDVFSLVTFNSTVKAVVPVAKGADLSGVPELIAGIRASGDTDLYGGYEKGFELACEARSVGTSRIVLLSDGKANKNITSSAELQVVAGMFRERQITTTTFGVGNNFDEMLMTGLAESGGGSANFIEHAWQAAEIFREELEDLRTITATNAQVRFNPSTSVLSCMLLNSFPADKENFWLVGDVSCSRERQVVMELEVKTTGELGQLELGTFEVKYNVSGKTVFIPRQVPVFVPVVSLADFSKVTPDNDVILDALFLTIGRAKRDAMRLSCEGKFIEAADLLDLYISSISELSVQDLEFDREIEKLKERAWNLRNCGKEYFTETEKKYITYEADMTLKGKKSMYRAMQGRQVPMSPAASQAFISVRSHIDGREFAVASSPARTVSDFLKEVFTKLGGTVEPDTYGRKWILRDDATSRVFDLGSSYARSIGQRQDRRMLKDVNLNNGLNLSVVMLPTLPAKPGHMVMLNVIRIDMAMVKPGPNCVIDINYNPHMVTSDFLASIYREISSDVPPNSYGSRWVLRDVATGRVFDLGSPWARFHQLHMDIRPLERVGIRGGCVLKVELVVH